MPKSLDLSRLNRFEPTKTTTKLTSESDQSGPHELLAQRWPSREAVADGQISIKGPLNTINRFKVLCKEDRRTYADMLEILMDHFGKMDERS